MSACRKRSRAYEREACILVLLADPKISSPASNAALGTRRLDETPEVLDIADALMLTPWQTGWHRGPPGPDPRLLPPGPPSITGITTVNPSYAEVLSRYGSELAVRRPTLLRVRKRFRPSGQRFRPGRPRWPPSHFLSAPPSSSTITTHFHPHRHSLPFSCPRQAPLRQDQKPSRYRHVLHEINLLLLILQVRMKDARRQQTPSRQHHRQPPRMQRIVVREQHAPTADLERRGVIEQISGDAIGFHVGLSLLGCAELRDAGHEEENRHEEAGGGVEFGGAVELEMGR
jgi:hypothetical protein